MSISSLTNAPACAEHRRPSSKSGEHSRASFQAQLEQASSGAAAQQPRLCTGGDVGDSSLPSQSAVSRDYSSFMKEDLLTVLYDAKVDMVERMKKSKEKTEEAENWERLMKYVDAWIESLREEADVEKIARAYASLKAVEADAAAERKDLRSLILEQLASGFAG